MNARDYDPQLGQFISPDTLVPDATQLIDFNRYAYARGNPMKYNDPSGHNGISIEGQCECGGGLLPGEVASRQAAQAGLNVELTGPEEVSLINAQEAPVAPEAPAPSTPLENAVSANDGAVAPDAPPTAEIGSSQTSDTLTLENSIAGNNTDAAYLRELPQRYGNKGPTSGTLVVNGQKYSVESGENGPASNMPKGAPGFNAYVRTHAEGNAAAEMHRLGAQSGTLYINNNAGPCEACLNNLDYAVPKGSTLRVVWGDLFGIQERTFGPTAK